MVGAPEKGTAGQQDHDMEVSSTIARRSLRIRWQTLYGHVKEVESQSEQRML